MLENKRVVRNILWNFAGNALPLIAGVLSFPFLLDGLGTDRFGLLMLAWVLVGYFGLFDFGLSRAVTHMVAHQLSAGDAKAASGIAATALRLMWVLGMVAAAMVLLFAAWLPKGVLEIPKDIQQETVASFCTLALSVPFVIHTAGLRGLLEAQHAFRAASLIRMLLGVGTFVGPLIGVSLGGGLVSVMGILVVVRVAGWFLHKCAVDQCIQVSLGEGMFSRHWLRPLLTYGGWLTVTNIVGPLMVYLDRFVVGATLSVTAVTYYSVPYEVVTRVWVISAAITGVLFPLFSASWGADQAKGAHYMRKGALYVTMALFPICAFLAYLAPEIFNLWLGSEFADKSTTIFRWLTAGVLIGGVAQVFFALVQGAGRSDWTGKLHLAEAIPYWLLLLLMLHQYGVVGAAVAWFVRTAVDAIVLIWLASKLGSAYKAGVFLPITLTIAATTHLLASMLMDGIVMRSLFLTVSFGVFAWFAWRHLVHEREWLSGVLVLWGRGRDAA